MNILRSMLVFVLLLATATADRSNSLVILGDDMGWRDVGFTGNKVLPENS